MLNEFRNAITAERKRIQRKASANNRDLRQQIHRDTVTALQQTRHIAKRFKGGSCYQTAANVHRFLRENFLYKIDSPKVQRIKLPSAFTRDLYADCKTFSLMAFALLKNAGCKPAYKYASYEPGSRTPSHIYVVVDANGREIVVDGTSPDFNYEKPPAYSFKIDPMRVETIQDEVLANEVLADETLTSEATRAFVARLKGMNVKQRKQFINSFNPNNRKKLLRSVKSYLMNKKLNKMKGGMNDEQEAIFGFVDNENPFVGASHLADEAVAGKGYANRSPLAGKKAKRRRAARKEKKAAKAKPGSNKAKRLATKAKILKAKAAGDKGALKAARKERRTRIKENAKKVGKVFNKINPVLALGRGAFLGLVKLNVRGFAANIAQIQDKSELKKKWEAIGGKWGRLQDAVNKGKGKKALLGKKKISDEAIFSEAIADGGASAATITAASGVIAILLPTIMNLLKKEGKKPTEDLNGDGLINELDSPAAKTKFGAFVDKVQDFIEERPVLEAAYEAGSEKLSDKLEELGIKKGAGEDEEEETEEEGTPGWKIAALGAAVVGGIYFMKSKSKKAA